MRKETMMKILDNPTAYSSNERLTAARLAITFLDLLSAADTPTENEQAVEAGVKGWCNECDAEIFKEDAKFCQNCGTKF